MLGAREKIKVCDLAKPSKAPFDAQLPVEREINGTAPEPRRAMREARRVAHCAVNRVAHCAANPRVDAVSMGSSNFENTLGSQSRSAPT